ncbi:MAG: hypothetical protein LBL24_09725 [Bacteroidales bacterium]|jgi:hypothetical protein|nr:hypothetical protein [Bacteroidales bacterium]
MSDMICNRRIKAFEFRYFIILWMIVPMVSLLIGSCSRTENQDEGLNSENEEASYVPNRMNAQQLLAIAVDKSFENSSKPQLPTKGLVSGMNRYQTVAGTDNILHISYPYDYIKIYDVVKFSCAGVKNPLVQEICGDGELEVFIAGFALFLSTEEEKADVKSSNVDESILRNMMTGREPMIVFKSDLGIYSCIANSGGVIDATDIINSGYHIDFSSHKYLSDKALEKNFLYPIFEFIVTSENGKVSLGTMGTDEDYSTTVYDSKIPLSNQQTVSPQELFSLVELSSNIPEVSLQCEVTELNENYFTVTAGKDFNLERVYYDEYTEFIIGGKTATDADIAVGNIINVTFGKLYENYNPKSVIANKISYP